MKRDKTIVVTDCDICAKEAETRPCERCGSNTCEKCMRRLALETENMMSWLWNLDKPFSYKTLARVCKMCTIDIVEFAKGK